MKILHIVPRIADQSSGPSHSVVRLCQEQRASGAEVELHVLEPLPERDLRFSVEAHACSGFPGAWRLGWSPAMRQALYRKAQSADLVHNHSLWMMPNVYCAEAANKACVPLVVSPRGTLAPWARRRSQHVKGLMWWYGQRSALHDAAGFHATSDMEREDIREAGFQQPMVVAQNGVDIPHLERHQSAASSTRKLLFLSRIHPTKGLDLLLDAWSELIPTYADWELLIAGPLDNSYAVEMQRKAAELERVVFLGEVTGEAKSELFLTADLFVLLTHTENFGLAIAEALAHGVPAIVTRGAPWSGLVEEKCGWWIERERREIERTLHEAMSLPAKELQDMGQRGKGWMQRDFNWHKQAEKLLRFYRNLMEKGHQGLVSA